MMLSTPSHPARLGMQKSLTRSERIPTVPAPGFSFGEECFFLLGA